MKKSISDKPFYQIIFFIILINLASLIYIFFNYKNLPPEIPLWYGQPIGYNQLAQKNLMFLPSLISLIYSFLSFFFIKKSSDKFLNQVVMGTLFLSTFLTSYTTLKIINLIG